MPGIMTQPYPMEFLFTPGKVTIMIEAYSQWRQIFTDGRKHPEDPDLTFNGHSIGHWEGDTLVVDTVGFTTDTALGGFRHASTATRCTSSSACSSRRPTSCRSRRRSPTRSAHEALDEHARLRAAPRLDARGVRVPAEQPQFHDGRRQGRHQFQARGSSDERRKTRTSRRVRAVWLRRSALGAIAAPRWLAPARRARTTRSACST